jgi:BirA family transcriptional regulator, biotin operon repressor / biotin---[acetyl-CoA-carboxylase] ligase
MLKEKIKSALIEAKNTFVSGETLAKVLNVSRTTVNKAINQLRKQGVDIESHPKVGYRINNSDVLGESYIRKNITSFYHTVKVKEITESTNDDLKAIQHSIKEGYVMIADEQTRGKGRNGRSFHSEKGKGIYLSLFLTPNLPIDQALKITTATAVACAEAIELTFSVKPGIKWVNDLMIEQKKIGGILCEAGVDIHSGTIETMVVGLGLNVFSQEFDESLSQIAGSIEDFSSRKNSRNELIIAFLNRFDYWYKNLNHPYLIKRYKQYSNILHVPVTVTINNESYLAVIKDIDENGACIAVKSDGTTVTLNSGEVTIRRNYQYTI